MSWAHRWGNMTKMSKPFKRLTALKLDLVLKILSEIPIE